MRHSTGAPRRILRPLHVRDANRSTVLQLLRHNDHISRADLARLTSLSEGAVSRIVGGLIADGLVREDGEENSTGGRPGRRLDLDPRPVAIGADIQNWETRVAVSTMRGRIVETRRFRTPATPEATLAQIAEVFQDCRQRFASDVAGGLGIAARGIVNSDTGVVLLGNRTEWTKIPVRKILEAKLGEPVYVENNVRAAALAEYNYGAPEVFGSQCFLLVKIDEGVGMGILLGGKLYYGPRMAAGEFGQMIIDMHAGASGRVRQGSLESLVANPAICERYAVITKSQKAAATGDTWARVRRIARQAVEGETSAREAIEETARLLATGIANVAWGLDADVVVIDGAITEAWPLLDPVLRTSVSDDGYEGVGLNVLIRPSILGGDAALIGAATLPFTTVFSSGSSRPGVTASA